MCSMYWNLNAKITCPKCGKKDSWNLSTHFMGDIGSCSHEYKLREDVKELKGVNVLLDGRIDAFVGDCPKCEKVFDLGGDIVNGRVEEIFFINTNRA